MCTQRVNEENGISTASGAKGLLRRGGLFPWLDYQNPITWTRD